MIAVTTTGRISVKLSKILIEMERRQDLVFTNTATSANFLVIGVKCDKDIYSKLIFDKDDKDDKNDDTQIHTQIYTDVQFDGYLRDHYSAYYL